jgi:hypothetical protein
VNKIYLILAHKNCKQLERQITSLDDGSSSFYVHIDSKSDLTLFASLGQIKSVFLISERVDCIWGDFSMVRATLNLIQSALKNHTDGMCILMSGNDYPIKSKSYINTFFDKNRGKVFIDMNEAKNVWPTFHTRIENYRINASSDRGSFKLLKGFNKETIKYFIKGHISLMQFLEIVFKKRKLNINIRYYGGSQWWAMDMSILTKLNDFIEKNKVQLFKFFSYSHVPDEFFFHSIIMHLKELGATFQVENTLTYVNWTRQNCDLPVIFNLSDIKELTEQPSGKLFARKFDLEADSKILDELDAKMS